jgi:hypothetical protein
MTPAITAPMPAHLGLAARARRNAWIGLHCAVLWFPVGFFVPVAGVAVMAVGVYAAVGYALAALVTAARATIAWRRSHGTAPSPSVRLTALAAGIALAVAPWPLYLAQIA